MSYTEYKQSLYEELDYLDDYEVDQMLFDFRENFEQEQEGETNNYKSDRNLL
jgi:uncharacterized membrane protein